MTTQQEWARVPGFRALRAFSRTGFLSLGREAEQSSVLPPGVYSRSADFRGKGYWFQKNRIGVTYAPRI